MATAKANALPHLVHFVIRPALVEAKLMTEKHARDAVYVATLTEELRNIELKIAATEETLQLGSASDSSQPGPSRDLRDWTDARWIREKSCELDQRLRRIEESSKLR